MTVIGADKAGRDGDKDEANRKHRVREAVYSGISLLQTPLGPK